MASNKLIENRNVNSCNREAIGVTDDVEFLGIDVRNQTSEMEEHRR